MHTTKPATSPAKGVPAAATTASKRPPLWTRPAIRMRLWVLLTQVVLTVALVGLWQWAADTGRITERRYGSPSGVWEALRALIDAGELYSNTKSTLHATVLGFIIGAVLGVFAGLLLGSWRFIDRVFSPLIAILNSMPRIAFAPLLIVWFGLSIWAKVWMAASLCVFIMLINTRAAARSVDRDLKTLARVNEIGMARYFVSVVVPSSMPAILAGMRLSIVFSLLGVIASEMIVAREGLGTLIVKYSSTTLNVNAIYSVLLVIALLAAALTVTIEFAERRLLRWQ